MQWVGSIYRWKVVADGLRYTEFAFRIWGNLVAEGYWDAVGLLGKE